jgi:hypothetical protein
MASTSDQYRIFVYGAESKGLSIGQAKLSTKRYTLEFFPRHETPRFQDADGAIVFQGSFESFEWVSVNPLVRDCS